MKKIQRILATALLIPTLSYSSRADVLALWTFETADPIPVDVTASAIGPFTADIGLNANGSAATGLHASGTTVWSSVAGNGSPFSLNSNGWAIGDYYQFSAATTGFQDINLSWDQTASGTGPRDFDLMYSTNGADFSLVPAFDNYAVLQNGGPNTAWAANGTRNGVYTFSADLSSIATLNNVGTVYFRLVMASTTSASGATVANGGTNRVDNFSINGVTFGAAEKYWDVNGTTAGLGGSGTWTGSSTTWNTLANGTGPVAALDSLGKAVFQGAGGTVTIGSGATANAGIFFKAGGYTLQGGTLALTGTGPKVEVTNAGDSATISAALSGTSGLAKTGPGTLVLSGANTFTGGLTISAGTLQVNSDAALGDSAGEVVLSGGTLKVNSGVNMNSSRKLSGAGSLDIAPGATLSVAGQVAAGVVTLVNTGTLAFTGTVPKVSSLSFQAAGTVSSSSPLTIGSGITTTQTTGTVVVSGQLDLDTGTRTLSVARGSAAADLRFTGSIVGNNPASPGISYLFKTGEGIVDFAGDNSGVLGGIRIGSTGTSAATAVPGGTVIVHDVSGLGQSKLQFNAGTLQNASGSLISFNNALSVGAGQLPGGATFTGSPFEFFGETTIFKGGTAATSYQHRITANTDLTFSGGLNEATGTDIGSGTSTGLTFAGTGRVFMPTSSNFTTNITVDGAKLYVTANLSAAAKPKITAINGGQIGGDTSNGGSLGVVAAQDGGVIIPGTPVDRTGVLHTGNVEIPFGTALMIDLNGTSAGQFDQLNVTGTVTLGGVLEVSLQAGYTPTPGDTFLIILNDGASALGDLTGTFVNLPDGATFLSNSYYYRIDYDAGDGNDVMLTAVPEPASAALMLGGLAILAMRRRRKG